MSLIETIELRGNSIDRGRAHGEERAVEIESYIAAWLGSLHQAGIVDPEKYIARFVNEAKFGTAIEKHVRGLFDEVRAIAEGAQQPLGLLMGTQLMDEEWSYRSTFLRASAPQEKCSSVAIRASEERTWIGQNMDLGAYTEDHQLLLRIAPHAGMPGALVFTVGGMIGLMGVNSCGLGVCVNSLPQLPTALAGVPVSFVVRRLLQCSGMVEAVAAVRNLPHATGQHYLLADASYIRSFEASPCGVVEYHSPNPSRVLHTNHPLAHCTTPGLSAHDLANSLERLRSMTSRLMAGDVDLTAIKSALSSSDDPRYPVCRVRKADELGQRSATMGFTTGSMISELRPDREVIHSWVSKGPPSLHNYASIELES